MEIILTLVINQVCEAELPLSTFLWPDNIRALLFALIMSQQGQGDAGGVGWCECSLHGAILSKEQERWQKSTSCCFQAVPTAFRVRQRQDSENTAGLRPLGSGQRCTSGAVHRAWLVPQKSGLPGWLFLQSAQTGFVTA